MTMQNLLRVHREIQNVNDDFHSLRTVFKETDHKQKWDFVMFPNDGALSHLPLMGEMIIPDEYPTMPPVLHLFTRTMRYNVDVYRSNVNDNTRSTMCFDILRSKTQGGTWEPSFTISCLIASLMQALVSLRVPQQYGSDMAEFVTMAKLDQIKQKVAETYNANKRRFPHLPEIPTIPATSVPAKPFLFTRPDETIERRSLMFDSEDKFVSQPIYLQDSENPQSWSTMLDLRNLHAGIVFSVILSNKRGVDVAGYKNNTILLRNGVTGTAAKKRANQPVVWFYHGKPLNDRDLSICVTVSRGQFTISYKADGNTSFLVHGDTPISNLGVEQIGDVKGVPFYLTILLKRKSGKEGFINVLDQNEVGFIHGNTSAVWRVSQATATPMRRVPLAKPISKAKVVKLAIGGENTIRLQWVIDFYGLGLDFKIQHGFLEPAYETLFIRDRPSSEEYDSTINGHYIPLCDKLIEVNVTAIIADGDCVALLTDRPRCVNECRDMLHTSGEAVLYITMRLRNDSIRAEYTNTLATRLAENHENDWTHVGDVYVKLPQPIRIIGHLEFEHNL